MKGTHEDRRVRRTKRALQEALRSLILQKGYDRVTVQDVIDRADVGRATFYAHFRDKDDLLKSGFKEMQDSLRDRMAAFLRDKEHHSDEGLEVAHALFDHAAGRRGEYRALVGSRGGGAFLKLAHRELTSLVRGHFDQAVSHHRLKPVVPVEVTAYYAVSALLALLTWWLDNDVSETPEQMARMFQHLTKPAIAAGLSLNQ